MKACAIFLMVLGHSGFEGKKFIYLFHMAVFFMVSGYLYRPNYEGKIKGVIQYGVKKIKGIWFPYFIWNLVYTLLNNVFLKMKFYAEAPLEVAGKSIEPHSYLSIGAMLKNIIKGIAMMGRTEFGGAFWFLRTLFAISILFCVIDYGIKAFIKSEKLGELLHFLLSIIFLLLGYVAHLMKLSNVSVPVVLSAYILYYLGYMLKKYNLMDKVSVGIASVAGFIALLICNIFGSGISIGDNSYANPIYFLICSFSGWLWLYGIADLCVKKKDSCKVLEFMGQNTLPIVIHHFWCFKLIHLIQIWIYDYPIESLAAFPNLNTNGVWWLAYLLVGIGLPLVLQWIWGKIKGSILCFKVNG